MKSHIMIILLTFKLNFVKTVYINVIFQCHTFMVHEWLCLGSSIARQLHTFYLFFIWKIHLFVFICMHSLLYSITNFCPDWVKSWMIIMLKKRLLNHDALNYYDAGGFLFDEENNQKPLFITISHCDITYSHISIYIY